MQAKNFMVRTPMLLPVDSLVASLATLAGHNKVFLRALKKIKTPGTPQVSLPCDTEYRVHFVVCDHRASMSFADLVGKP